MENFLKTPPSRGILFRSLLLTVGVLALGLIVLASPAARAQEASAPAASAAVEAVAETAAPVAEAVIAEAVTAPAPAAHGAPAPGGHGAAPTGLRDKHSENLPHFSLGTFITNVLKTTGIYAFMTEARAALTPGGEKTMVYGWQSLIMILVGLVLVYLGAVKNFEPLLLLPIAFGTILVNVPIANMGEPGGFLRIIFDAGVGNEFFPLIIFMGIGALTDFGPLIANPKTALLGAAAQFGVFGTILGAVLLNFIPGVAYTLREAASISIIGGADGPTSIYLAANLAPHLLGPIAVAAYSYMALVPLIQPPIMKALTTDAERRIKMRQLRHVSKLEKILFPMIVLVLCIILIPAAAPLLGAFALGNFIREIGIVDRLNKTLQNELLNITTILLSLGVGSQMTPDKFMQPQTLGIVLLGLIAFALATAAGVLLAKFMNLFSKEKVNPLIGSAGVSAVPMAARVSQKVAQEYDPGNFILMHAMGPNVAGVIGTAVAAGVLIALFK